MFSAGAGSVPRSEASPAPGQSELVAERPEADCQHETSVNRQQRQGAQDARHGPCRGHRKHALHRFFSSGHAFSARHEIWRFNGATGSGFPSCRRRGLWQAVGTRHPRGRSSGNLKSRHQQPSAGPSAGTTLSCAETVSTKEPERFQPYCAAPGGGRYSRLHVPAWLAGRFQALRPRPTIAREPGSGGRRPADQGASLGRSRKRLRRPQSPNGRSSVVACTSPGLRTR
jgi:hypothetical protein